MSLHVIFGSGPMGLSVMEELHKRGIRARIVNRRGAAGLPAGVESFRADVFTGEGIAEAVKGASVVYQCVNPPYHEWTTFFPVMQRNIIDAAAKERAKVVIGENVYMYGDAGGRVIDETLPDAAGTKKGMLRARMADEAMRRHHTGEVRVTFGRASDFYGPRVTASAMGERQFGAAVSGGKFSMTGDPDLPHTFTYIRDVGRALADLGTDDRANGRVWHVPNAPAVTQRAFMELTFRELDTPPRWSVMGRTMMRIGGLFIPAAHESVEMMYQYERPFIVSSDKFERSFGWTAAPVDEGIRETVRWYLGSRTTMKG